MHGPYIYYRKPNLTSKILAAKSWQHYHCIVAQER